MSLGLDSFIILHAQYGSFIVAGGKLLLELNRVLRPGGYFVWSATPVYRKDTENAGIWKGIVSIN